jgi:hypothetical protein
MIREKKTKDYTNPYSQSFLSDEKYYFFCSKDNLSKHTFENFFAVRQRNY